MQSLDIRKPGEWVHRPIVAVGPPDAESQCHLLALPGLKRAQRHPVTRQYLYSSHNGVLNVYGSGQGLLATAVVASQVNHTEGFCDSTIYAMHKHDVDVFLECLTEQFDLRHQAVWSKEGLQGLLQNE
jgi:hypothetical protein